jgi:pyruvate kinase
MKRLQSTDKMVEAAANRLNEIGAVSRGDLIAVIAGSPIAKKGTTNFLKVHRIGS